MKYILIVILIVCLYLTIVQGFGNVSQETVNENPSIESQHRKSNSVRKCPRGKMLEKKCKYECKKAAIKPKGLALTPPMGWLAWERFRCETNCRKQPSSCISERLFMEMADMFVRDGYDKVGYEYIIMDDCWMARTRDSEGKLRPDPDRFPSGIRALADYVHKKGLKFGIYGDYGNFTCGGYPGSLGNIELDAQTFVDWGVDYVKLDTCYSDLTNVEDGYREFQTVLRKSGRPIVFSCSWPAYTMYYNITTNWTAVTELCNLWRNSGDMDDSWDSVQYMIAYYAANQNLFIPLAGSGHWNDPDMLIIGDYGLSYEQSKTQFAIWAILAAPLLMSVDLRTIRPIHKKILQNRQVIAVNQDNLGIQGRFLNETNGVQIWARPIESMGNFAIVFFNRRTDGTPIEISLTISSIGLNNAQGYRCKDLFSGKKHRVIFPSDIFNVQVNPTGVVMLRFRAIKSKGKF